MPLHCPDMASTCENMSGLPEAEEHSVMSAGEVEVMGLQNSTQNWIHSQAGASTGNPVGALQETDKHLTANAMGAQEIGSQISSTDEHEQAGTSISNPVEDLPKADTHLAVNVMGATTDEHLHAGASTSNPVGTLQEEDNHVPASAMGAQEIGFQNSRKDKEQSFVESQPDTAQSNGMLGEILQREAVDSVNGQSSKAQSMQQSDEAQPVQQPDVASSRSFLDSDSTPRVADLEPVGSPSAVPRSGGQKASALTRIIWGLQRLVGLDSRQQRLQDLLKQVVECPLQEVPEKVLMALQESGLMQEGMEAAVQEAVAVMSNFESTLRQKLKDREKTSKQNTSKLQAVQKEMTCGLLERLQEISGLPHAQSQRLVAPLRSRPAPNDADVVPFYFFAPAIEGLNVLVLGNLPQLGSASFEPLRGQPTLALEEVEQDHARFLVARAMLPAPASQEGPWFRYVVCAEKSGKYVIQTSATQEVEASDSMHQILYGVSLPLFRLCFQSASHWLTEWCMSGSTIEQKCCNIYMWSDLLRGVGNDTGGISLMGAIRSTPVIPVAPVPPDMILKCNYRQLVYILLITTGSPSTVGSPVVSLTDPSYEALQMSVQQVLGDAAAGMVSQRMLKGNSFADHGSFADLFSSAEKAYLVCHMKKMQIPASECGLVSAGLLLGMVALVSQIAEPPQPSTKVATSEHLAAAAKLQTLLAKKRDYSLLIVRFLVGCCPSVPCLLHLLDISDASLHVAILSCRFCATLDMASLAEMMRDAPQHTRWFRGSKSVLQQVLLDKVAIRLAVDDPSRFEQVMLQLSGVLKEHYTCFSGTLLRTFYSLARPMPRIGLVLLALEIVEESQTPEDWNAVSHEFKCMAAMPRHILAEDILQGLSTWFPVLGRLQTLEPKFLAHALDNRHTHVQHELVAALFGQPSAQQMLQLFRRQPFQVWPFQQQVQTVFSHACNKSYKSSTAVARKLCDNLEALGQTSGNELVATHALAELVAISCNSWQAALADEACSRLPDWNRRFPTNERLSKQYQQLQLLMRNVLKQVEMLEFNLQSLVSLVNDGGPLQRTVQKFQAALPIGSEEQTLFRVRQRVEQLDEWRRSFSTLRIASKWHPMMKARLASLSSQAQSLESEWDTVWASELEARSEVIVKQLPPALQVMALEESPRIRGAIVKEVLPTASSEGGFRSLLEVCITRWTQCLQSLMLGTISLRRAWDLQLPSSGLSSVKDWLLEELKACCQLSTAQMDFDIEVAAERVQALAGFHKMVDLLKASKNVIGALHQAGRFVVDEGFQKLDKHLQHALDVDWCKCPLSDIHAYDASHALDLDPTALAAEALLHLDKQCELLRLLRQTDCTLDFIQQSSSFQDFVLIVRENTTDFSQLQLTALNELEEIRPFLLDVLFPGGHSLDSFLSALKTGSSHRVCELLPQVDDLLRVAALMYQSVSRDAVGRDSQLVDQLLTGTWVIYDAYGASLELAGKRHGMEELQRVHDRLLLDVSRPSQPAQTGRDKIEGQRQTAVHLICHLLQLTSSLLIVHQKLEESGMPHPGTHRIHLAEGRESVLEHLQKLLEEEQLALQQWKERNLEFRLRYPILNFFTHKQIMTFADPGLSRLQLSDLLRCWDAAKLMDVEWVSRLHEQLKPAVGGWSQFTRWACSTWPDTSLSPLVRNEARQVLRVAIALDKATGKHQIAHPATVPLGLKVGKPNLILVSQVSSMSLSALALFEAAQHSLPRADQLLMCSRETRVEDVRLFLLRCMLAPERSAQGLCNDESSRAALHVIFAPERLTYKAQERLLSFWWVLNQRLDTSAGRGRFMLAIISLSGKGSLISDAFRGFQQDPPPQQRQRLENLLGSKATFVQSAQPCSGKTLWVTNECQRRCWRLSCITLNELTEDKDIAFSLRQCDRRAVLLVISPLVQASRLDALLFQILALRWLTLADGKSHVSPSQTHLFIEIPNVMSGESIIEGLGLSQLIRRVSINGSPRDLNTENSQVQYAARYLRALSGNFGDYLHEHLRGEACMQLLDQFGPHTETGHGLRQSPLVRSVHFAKLVCRLFAYLERSSVQQAVYNANCGPRNRRVPDLKLRLQRSMACLASELASRPLLSHSFLPEQAVPLGLPARDGSRSFRLLKVWSERLVMFPAYGQHHWVTDLKQLMVPICRSLSQVSVKEKKVWQGLGFELWDYTELRPGTDVESGDGEQFLNSIFCVCPDNSSLLRHVQCLQQEPALRTFTLTVDNLMKMVAIYFRLDAGVPLVLMGESGCGKSAVVRYLGRFLGLQVFTLDVHGGLSEDDVVNFMSGAVAAAFGDSQSTVWAFLDEINTAGCVGLFRELVCDGSMRGTAFPNNLRVFAACNPYRPQASNASAVGLDASSMPYSSVCNSNKFDRSLEVPAPLEQLVYAVYPLPPSLIECAWDFGMLSGAEERRYARAILSSVPDMGEDPEPMLACMVCMTVACHDFMRKHTNEVSVVSLRDISRLSKLTSYFLKKIPHQRSGDDDSSDCLVLEAFFAAFCLCYWFRLGGQGSRHRKGLLQAVQVSLCKAFNDEWVYMSSRWKWCSLAEGMSFVWPGLPDGWQKSLTDRVEQLITLQMDWMISALSPLPPGVAANQALRENIFIMVVCIDARIPLIIVGKPGSSKSLAMQLVRDRFHRETKPAMLRDAGFPDVGVFPYQCSKHAKAQDIERRFQDAQQFEQTARDQQRRGVVFLDEVGLAERSPDLPLKVLHKLLEMPDQQVSFIGLSNWALDAAKMNRCLLLARDDATQEDLYATACAIVAVGRQSNLLDAHLKVFCTSFMTICRKLQENGCGNFSGLRDFYAFIKLLDRMLPDDATEIPPMLVARAVLRSFSGVPVELLDQLVLQPFFATCASLLEREFLSPSEMHLPVLPLLQANLDDLPTADGSVPGARHLMIFSRSSPVMARLLREKLLKGRQVVTVFGSSFPADQSVGAIYSSIAQVKYFMEVGGCAILIHSEDVYESLYDMLNQFYTRALGRNLCRLAVGAESRQCEVHPAFRCIVMADEASARDYPPPLLNRFEKQRLQYEDFLHTSCSALENRVVKWASQVVGAGGQAIKVSDAMIGFDLDLVKGLILAAEYFGHDIASGVESVDSSEGATEHNNIAPSSGEKWVRERLLHLLAPEVWTRCKANDALTDLIGASAVYSTLSLREVLLDMRKQSMHAMLIYTFAANGYARLEHGVQGCSASCHWLDTMQTASDAHRLLDRFFADDSNEFLMLQIAASQGDQLLQTKRKIMHLLHMSSEMREQAADHNIAKRIVMIMHVVKGAVPSASDIALPYQGEKGVGVCLLDELLNPEPWEARVLSHEGGSTWWNDVLSRDLLRDVALRNLRLLALIPIRAQQRVSRDSVAQEEILASMSSLREALNRSSVCTHLEDHVRRELRTGQSFMQGWQAKISDSDVARAGSFRRAQLRHLERALLAATEQAVTVVALGSVGRSAFSVPPHDDAAAHWLWHTVAHSEAVRQLALSHDDAASVLCKLRPVRQALGCPFSLVLFDMLDGACMLAQDSIHRVSEDATPCIVMRNLVDSMPWPLAEWCTPHACRLYCADAVHIVSRQQNLAIQINIQVISSIVYTHTACVCCDCVSQLGPDQIHLSLRRLWPLIVNINSLIANSLETDRQQQWNSLHTHTDIEVSLVDGHSTLRGILAWVKEVVKPCASKSLPFYVVTLRDAASVLEALCRASSAHDIQRVDRALHLVAEAELRTTRLLRMAVSSLVLPLDLGWSSVKSALSVLDNVGSPELQLQHVGDLVVALCPLTRSWTSWFSSFFVDSGGVPQHEDVARVRLFFGNLLSVLGGPHDAGDLALFLSLGTVPRPQTVIKAMMWLQDSLRAPALSHGGRVRLARSLLSDAHLQTEIHETIEAILVKETNKSKGRDHLAGAVIVDAYMQEVMEELREGRTNLQGLALTFANGCRSKGLNFYLAVAAAKVVLAHAAEAVLADNVDDEISTSAAHVLDTAGCLRRSLDVFLAKSLRVDRIELARLVKKAQNGNEVWSFMLMPDIRNGLPAFSMLDVGLDPSCDCLPDFLGQPYIATCEAIAQSGSVGRSNPVAGLMAIFSAIYLGHSVGRQAPQLEIASNWPRKIQQVASKMVGNFAPSASCWRVTANTTPQWMLMIRPIVHLAAIAASSHQDTFWRRLLVEPQSLRGIVMPFMPGDELGMVFAAMQERVAFYTCPNGHPYAIGNCTRPWEVATCRECGAQIGGTNHQSAQGNRPMDRRALGANATPPGYPMAQVGSESRRQTWRSLGLNELRSGRFFVHGLLSLAAVLTPEKVANLHFDLTAESAMARLEDDWSVLRDVLGYSNEQLSERMHAIVQHVENFGRPTQIQGEAERTQLEAHWVQQLRVAEHWRPPSAQHNPQVTAQRRLQEELEERQPPELVPNRDTSMPLLLRCRNPPSATRLQELLECSPENAATYPLALLLLKREAELVTVSKLASIVEFQQFLSHRLRRRISRQQARALSVNTFVEQWLRPSEQQHFWSLYERAHNSWNAVVPHVDHYECRQINLPPMPDSPNALCIIRWLRSPEEDSPESLHALVLVRWLITLHNELLQGVAEALQVGTEHRPLCSLSCVLEQQLFHYQPGTVDRMALEAYQGSAGPGVDWALINAAAQEIFASVCRVSETDVETFEFLGEGQTSVQRLLCNQKPMPAGIKEALLRDLQSPRAMEECLQLLQTVEAWLRLCDAEERTVAEYARTVMQVPVSEIDNTLDMVPISCVQDAIDCLSGQIADPLEELSDLYNQAIPDGQNRLRELSPAELPSLIQEWRKFLRSYLSGFKEPYRPDTSLWHFWSGQEEELSWVARIREMDLKLGSFGPSFRVVKSLSETA